MELIGALEQSAIGSDTDDTDDNIDITLKHFLLQFRYQPHHFVADGLQGSQVLDLQPTTSTNPPRVKKKALAFVPPLLRYYVLVMLPVAPFPFISCNTHHLLLIVKYRSSKTLI